MITGAKAAAMLPSHAASAGSCRSALCPSAVCLCAARNLQASRAKATMEEACLRLDQETSIKAAAASRPAGAYGQHATVTAAGQQTACSDATITQTRVSPIFTELTTDPVTATAVERRPAFHLAPPSGWINGRFETQLSGWHAGPGTLLAISFEPQHEWFWSWHICVRSLASTQHAIAHVSLPTICPAADVVPVLPVCVLVPCRPKR